MTLRSLKPKPEVIDSLRAKQGMTLAEFAKATGCSSRTMDNVMAGQNTLIGTLSRIADGLGVEVKDIAEGFDPTPTSGQTYDVKFKLSVPHGEFNEEKLQIFADLLARLVGGSIMDADFTKGSTVVTVALTQEQIEMLMDYLPDFRAKVEAAFKKSAELQPITEQLRIQREELPLVRAVIEVTIPESAEFVPDEVRGKPIEVTD